MTPFNPSVISFLFLKFAIIAGGYVTQVIPCQTQRVLENNIFSKHIIGFLLAFAFIMLEGGWGFNEELEKSHPDNDWSNGNALESMVFALILYLVFLLTAKMKLIPNLILYALLFSLYIFNTQKNYWKNRDLITEQQNNTYEKIIDYLIYISIAVGVYGIIDYFIYKKKSYGKNFTVFKFLVGNVNVVTKLFKYFLIIFK